MRSSQTEKKKRDENEIENEVENEVVRDGSDVPLDPLAPYAWLAWQVRIAFSPRRMAANPFSQQSITSPVTSDVSLFISIYVALSVALPYVQNIA